MLHWGSGNKLDTGWLLTRSLLNSQGDLDVTSHYSRRNTNVCGEGGKINIVLMTPSGYSYIQFGPELFEQFISFLLNATSFNLICFTKMWYLLFRISSYFRESSSLFHPLSIPISYSCAYPRSIWGKSRTLDSSITVHSQWIIQKELGQSDFRVNITIILNNKKNKSLEPMDITKSWVSSLQMPC